MLKNKAIRTTLCILAGLISSLSLASSSYAANGNHSSSVLKGGVSSSNAPPQTLSPDERLGYILGGLNTPGAFPDVSLQQTGGSTPSPGVPSPHMMAGIDQSPMNSGELETRSSFTTRPQRYGDAGPIDRTIGRPDTPGGFVL